MAWSDGWVTPREQLKPLGPVQGLLPPLLLLSLSLARPSRNLNLTILPLYIYYSLYTSLFYTTGSTPDDYGRASLNFTLVLKAIDTFLLSKPSFELAFKKRKDAMVPRPWSLRRLGWALKVMTSLRGAGWEWQVVKKLGGSDLSRTRLIKRRLTRAILLYLSLDVISTYMQSRPYFHRLATLSSLSKGEQIINMISACAAAGLAINITYQILCIVCLVSQTWDPNECPDLFGSFKDAKNLRGFWGKTWHQSFRRPFTSIPSYLLHSLLCLSPSSPLTQSLSLFLTFGLSALLHAFSSFVMARTGLGSLKFFLIQPVGIILEQAVSNGVNGGSRDLRRFVGYAWTAAWLGYWCPWFFDELVQAGFWEMDPAPFSVVKGVWKGKWLNLPQN